jgi:nicotinamidase-related amidase
MKRLLVVVDYQKDFVSGSLGFAGAEQLEAPICEKIRTLSGKR